MANIYIYFDGRSPRKDGSGSLKMVCNHRHTTTSAALGIHILPSEWDSGKGVVVQRPDKKFLNVMLRKRLSDAEMCLQRLMMTDSLQGMTAKEILSLVMRGSDTVDSPEETDYVLPTFNEYITLCRKGNTATSYRTTLNNLEEFCKSPARSPHIIDMLTFRDISVAWLRKYQQWLYDEKKMEVNGANVYLRNLRTIFNYALKNELTGARYPFRDIDMSTTEPDKRTIDYNLFLKWLAFPIDPDDTKEMYRDLFMLSFYLCGMRPVDLLHVRKEQIAEGRLIYYPEKLDGRTRLSIKVEPEAAELIKKYEGRTLMLNIMEERKDFGTFCAHWNKALKVIGPEEMVLKEKNGAVRSRSIRHGIVPWITTYYARTCWASYAYNVLNTPMDIISQALGHKSGLKVTNFYVKRDESKVDECNRALIDRVNADLFKLITKGKNKKAPTKWQGHNPKKQMQME